MTLISKLWDEEKLPAKNGLYFADDKSFSIKLKLHPCVKIEAISEFDMGSFYRDDPDFFASIDITKSEQLQNGRFFCCGEGSSGADGFFALLAPEKKLLWAVFFADLNPFHDFSFEDNIAIVKSTSGVKIRLDLARPQTMEIIS